MAGIHMGKTDKITIEREVTRTGKATLIIRITDIANVLGIKEGDKVEVTVRKI